MRNGIEGFMAERLVELTEDRFNEENLRLLEQTPAAALGSCRLKLPTLDFENPEKIAVYQRIFEVIEKFDIRYFFYIGGNDSMDTVAKLSAYAEKIGYDIRIIGVPKTIDNDLAVTDHTPGFASAAKYIATTVREIIRDCAVYTVKAVTIVEIMGRGAGWLSASAALGRLADGTEPDYIYLPECVFDMESFFADIERAFEKHPNIVIAVSEGLRLADGSYVGESTVKSEADMFGHKALAGTAKALEYAVKERFGCKVRSIEVNLSQRCAGHLLSATDIEESVNIGREAVNSAVKGVSGEVMIYVRESGEKYNCKIEHHKASDIANEIKYLPNSFINEAKNGVTDECCGYLLPLIAGEYPVVYEYGLPKHIVI